MFDTVKRLFSRNFELTENILVLREQVQVGQRLQEVLEGKDFAVLKEHILLPLQVGAFEIFKKVDAKDFARVMETQMMSKMIDTIRKEIEKKINQGRLAEQQMKSLPELSGEEEE